jgi:tetratricopeptide (TPR) repeat protein
MTDNLIEIPGYTVHGRLGKGGMAEVYLATQQSLHRKVAVKVLLNAGDQEFNTRFIQEGHIVASLHNPSIITIYDINKLADGRFYMAMEFVPGGDLAQHKGQVFEPERALAIVRQIAGALAVVHGKGLIHRDIKPANILFRNDGTAVLTDFGIAKDMQIDSELTHFGVAVGSPAYSSPEQTQCQRLDARSDIYSLGLILLEMLTGSNPYRGSNYTQTVLNQVQMPVPVLPGHLAMFQALLERMLTKDPAQRLPDCKALLAALAQVELGDPDATQVRPALAVISPPIYSSVQAMPANAATASSPLRPFYWIIAGLLLLCGLVAGGIFYQQKVQIGDLLVQAEQRLQQGQLIEPQQDSAEHYFQQVLQLDSDNAEALTGLQRVLDLRIEGFLKSAAASLADKRLLLPEGNNAVFYYRQVLQLAPENVQANAGMLQVAEMYRDMAKESYRTGQFKAALDMIDRGLQVQPDNQELLAMRAEHEAMLASARAAQAERKKRQAAPPKSSAEEEKSWAGRWIDTMLGK